MHPLKGSLILLVWFLSAVISVGQTLVNLDFEQDSVGSQPEIEDVTFSPSYNNSTNGAVVIDQTYDPSNPLSGKSLYIYDQNGDLTNGDPTHLRFPFNGGTNRTEVRLSFDFQRAYASEAADTDTRVHLALGRVGNPLNNSDFRPFQLRILNNGNLVLNSIAGSETVATYLPDDPNHIDILANSHDNITINYDLEDLGTGAVLPNTLHLFLNEAKIGEFDFHVTPDPENAPQVIFNQEDYDLGQFALYQDSKRQGGIVFDNIIFTPLNEIFGPPSAPELLGLKSSSPFSVELEWLDTSDDEIGFVIERKIGGSGVFESLETVTSNVTTYKDESVLPEVTYTYRIIADNGFKSDPSNQLETTTPEQILPLIVSFEGDEFVLVGDTASFSVTAVGRDPLSYQWYSGSSGDISQSVNGATNAAFESGQLNADASFWVRVSNNEGQVDSPTFEVQARIGEVYIVTTRSEIENTLETALPGDTLVVPNGTYSDLVIELEGHGAENAPITLKAEKPGQVILTEESRVQIGGQWLVLEGFVFTGPYTGNDDEVIQFRSGGEDADDCRITDISIINYIPEDGSKTMWVSLRGMRNRVDHCYFSGHNVEGATLVARLDGEPDYHQIDHNHFANRIDSGGQNGWETIRIGTSDTSLSDSRTVVEHNLFSKTNGEIEIISNKSGENIYRYNTFYECQGTLTLRHGNRCVVEGNYFIGNFINQTGGVRVIGEDHRIINNYFESTTARAGAAITLYAGVLGGALNEYVEANNAIVAFNAFFENNGPYINIGTGFRSRDRTILPAGITVANNLMAAGSRTAGNFVSGHNPESQSWAGNIIFGRPIGGDVSEGFESLDPRLELDEVLRIQRISAISQAIDAGNALFLDVEFDMDGQSRIDVPDVGADEHSDGPIINRPLTAGDVGPSYNPALRSFNITLNIPIGNEGWPNLLSETGAFKDLVTLEPEDGILAYTPNLSFWSDYAEKDRWFYIPMGDEIDYSQDGDWRFPTGSVWIKHFELELDRGNPNSSKRVETRFIVKTEFSVVGVSYLWNEEGTEATLVVDDGVDFDLAVLVDEEERTQTWSIPSRDECLACHSITGGFLLSFNTRQLNRDYSIGGYEQNILKYLSDHQFLDEHLSNPASLPYFARPDDPNASLDFRARSYLAVNCVSCHQPGGTESDRFDVRPHRTLDRTGMIDGIPSQNNGEDTLRLIVRGDTSKSTIYQRMIADGGFTRMPNIATNEIDPVGTEMIRQWIEEGLVDYLTYSEWQDVEFGELKDALGGATQDPDFDGDDNAAEFLNRTNPLDGSDGNTVEMNRENGNVEIAFEAGPFAEYQIEFSSDLDNWQPLEGEMGRGMTVTNSNSLIGLTLTPGQINNLNQFFRIIAKEQ